MTYETLYEFFKWCSICNVVLLAWWAIWIMAAPNFVFKMHSKWFEMPREQFNITHYKGMLYFKIVVIVFFVIPWFVLWKMGGF